jgi:predicted dehydrogenase
LGRKLRVGLIGLGGVGRVHLQAYRTVAGIDVVAVADPDATARAAAAALSKARIYSDHIELLHQEDLDLACILTPAASHEAVALSCAEAGVHALCEKPLTLSNASAERMISAFRKRRLHLFYGASYRYLPAVRRARELIAEGAVGEVILMREQIIAGTGRDGCRPLGPAHYPDGGPGGTPMGLVDHGVHLIDTFRWLTGQEIVSVYGRGNISGEQLSPEFMHMTFDGGAVGYLVYEEGTYPTDLPGEGQFSWGEGWDSSGYRPAGRWHAQPGCIHVHGSRGALRIFHYANTLYLTDAAGTTQIGLHNGAAPGHFAAQMEAVAASLRKGEDPEVGGGEGLIDLQALLAVYESQKSGRRIDLASRRPPVVPAPVLPSPQESL